jgi:tight adherence protein C
MAVLNDPLFLIPAAVFVGIMLVGMGLAALAGFRRDRQEIVGKIQKGSIAGDDTDILSADEEKGGPGKALKSFLAFFGRKFGSRDKDEISALRKKFLQAGYRGEHLIPLYYGSKIVCTGLMIGAYYLLTIFVLRPMNLVYSLALAVLAGLAGYAIPSFWLKLKKLHRQEKVFEGLPDALDLMVVCVEAGMGLDAAIHRVASEIEIENKVVGEEFKVVGLELRAGKLRSDALRNLSMRCDQEDVSSLVALLIQTDKFGTSVAQALKVHADSMRVKRFQRAEELAAKIPVKLVFPLILFIFPALFVVIVGPAFITIYRNLFSIQF